MSRTKKGMTKEIYEHIHNNIHTLELDLENGNILNRESNSLHNNGYLRLQLAGKVVYQHQVFAVSNWGEACIGMTVNHINEVKTDNRSINLELLTLEDNVRVKTNKTTKPKCSIKATNIDTREEIVFESIMEATRQLGLRLGNIQGVLNGKRKRAGRYKFERVA